MMNPEGGKVSTGHNHGDKDKGSSEDHPENKYSQKDLRHDMFKVAGNCEMCKSRIEEAVMSLQGVDKAEWNVKLKMLEVVFDSGKLKVDDIHKAITKVGHDTEKEKASDDVYNALPGCCKYERSPSAKEHF